MAVATKETASPFECNITFRCVQRLNGYVVQFKPYQGVKACLLYKIGIGRKRCSVADEYKNNDFTLLVSTYPYWSSQHSRNRCAQ